MTWRLCNGIADWDMIRVMFGEQARHVSRLLQEQICVIFIHPVSELPNPEPSSGRF